MGRILQCKRQRLGSVAGLAGRVDRIADVVEDRVQPTRFEKAVQLDPRAKIRSDGRSTISLMTGEVRSTHLSVMGGDGLIESVAASRS